MKLRHSSTLAAIALLGSVTLAFAQTGTGTGSMGSGTSATGDTGRSSTDMGTNHTGHMDGAGTATAPNSGYQTKSGGPSGGRVDSN